MTSTLAAIEEALAVVQRTLDALNSRGDHEAAFEVVRAQYAASLRESWPQNLAELTRALQEVAGDGSVHLDEAERERVRKAVEVLQAALEQ
jgi:hypothetical protein